MDESQLFEIIDDGYELDSESYPYRYQLLCKRARGYLSVDRCQFQHNRPSEVLVGIESERGEGIDKFRKLIIELADKKKKHRLGYVCDDYKKTEYYLAAKFIDRPDGWPSKYDHSICGKKIQMWLVKSDSYDTNTELKSGHYVPLEFKQEKNYIYLLVDGFEDPKSKDKKRKVVCTVSIQSNHNMILECVSDANDQMCLHHESKMHFSRQPIPDQANEYHFVNSTDCKNYPNLEEPNIKH